MSAIAHTDYRAYLRDYIARLPRSGRGELSRIAAHLAINTTLLSQVMSGLREFSLDQALQLSNYLGHSEVETEYFLLLVQKERAATKPLRDHLDRQLLKVRAESLKLAKRITSERKLKEKEKSVFYSSWIYSAVHLYTSTKDKGVSLDDIAGRFDISRTRAKEIIDFLLLVGLCIEKHGRFLMGTQSTFVEKGSPHLLRHHSNWRVKAIQSSESLLDSELMYTGQVSLSQKDFEKLREELAEFLKKAMKVVKDSPAEDLACLNIDWFWIKK